MSTLPLFLITCFALAMTPGPNMLSALSLGMRYGFIGAAWGGFGMCLALALMAGLSGLGVGALLASQPTAFFILRWLGVGYLIWLAVQAYRAPVAQIDAVTPDMADGVGSPAQLVRRGMLISFSNPKALIFMTAFFPQFIDPALPVAPQLAVLILAMMMIEFGWIMTYAAGGRGLATLLSGPVAAKWLNRLTALLLFAAGVLLGIMDLT